jgi:capsule polysaccharide modification protein KpsS
MLKPNENEIARYVARDCFHLWSIADAKDGDVLYLQHHGKEHIIIYKGVIKERFRTFVSAYCAYNGIVDAFCFADVSRYADIAYGGIMPATKEQRDFLFQKMREEGYVWDTYKKELNKIE